MSTQLKMRLASFLLSVLLLANTGSLWAQCAMCKGQLESTSDTHVGLAVNDGILYLLALPFLIAGTVATLLYIQKRKQSGEQPMTTKG